MKLLNVQVAELFIDNIKNIFSDVASVEELAGTLEIQGSSKKEFGDFQTNFAMINSKKIGVNPREIASKIIENFGENDKIEKLEIAGPGFINIYLKNSFVNEELQKLGNEKYDFSSIDNDKKVIIDYSSPNIAKRMHIGHLRSTIIGDSIKRIMKYLDFDIIADNHVGDWGTQFGKLIVGYDNWLDKEAYSNDPIEELERIYVLFSEKAGEDPSLEDLAREELKKLQQGDERNLALWKEFIDISIKEYNKVYERLDVHFDLYNGESFYNSLMPQVLNDLKEKDLAIEDQEALVVFFDEETKLNPCIVQKKDGSFLYSTSDLATLKYKGEVLNIRKAVYVTDERQQDHFRQVFKISELLGEPYNIEKAHVWFGIMRFGNGVILSSRGGNIIRLVDLLDEAKAQVKKVIDEKNPDIPENEKNEIAESVGIGAIKYFDLSQNRTSAITFEWDKVLSFEGNTGPYLQYTYVRVMSIFRKLASENVKFDLNVSNVLYDNVSDSERELALNLFKLPVVATKAYESYRPNLVADYLFETAKLFNTFYNSITIIKEENDDIRNARLALCEKTASVLKEGLSLLGIKTVDRM